MAKLILKFKGKLIKEYPIEKPSIRIGRREGNDIRIDNLAVSGNHAKIQRVDSSYILVDLQSTNGTFLNRKKIVQAKLHHLDEITIGRHTLVFEDESQPSREADSSEEMVLAEAVSAAEAPTDEAQGAERAAEIARIEYLEPHDLPGVILRKKLTIIGRKEDADIRMKGPFAPKVAAVINQKPSGYAILPEEKVKLRVNGDLVTRQTPLADGDVIEIGSLKLLFIQTADHMDLDEAVKPQPPEAQPDEEDPEEGV